MKRSFSDVAAHIILLVITVVFTLLAIAGLAWVVSEIGLIGLLKVLLGGICAIVLLYGYFSIVYIINTLRGKIDKEDEE